MRVIVITGCIGTGKTTLSKNLARYLRKSRLNFLYLDVNKIIKKYNLAEDYDRKKKSIIVDIKKLNHALIYEMRRAKNLFSKSKFFGILIDSHLSHYLPKKYVDLCIVTKCNLKELKKRLEKRGYNKEKIRENLDAEIFDICNIEAMEKGYKIIIVDTDKKVSYERIIKEIKNNLYK